MFGSWSRNLSFTWRLFQVPSYGRFYRWVTPQVVAILSCILNHEMQVRFKSTVSTFAMICQFVHGWRYKNIKKTECTLLKSHLNGLCGICAFHERSVGHTISNPE